MKYFKIKNYEKYLFKTKGTGGSWIPLLCNLTHDGDYSRLHDSHKAHFVHLLLRANTNGNQFTCDSRALRLQLQCSSTVKIEVFEKLGLIEIYDNKIDVDLPLDREKDREKDSKEGSQKEVNPVPAAPSSPKKKPKQKEHTDTFKAETLWIELYTKETGNKPDRSPVKDRAILKQLIKDHGFDLVMKKIRMHLNQDKFLTIGGFKHKFNDLNDEPVDPLGIIV